MPKAEFIRSLQCEERTLSPYEISQRIRLVHGCVATYQADPQLSTRILRGYMVRWAEKPDRSPENPELYVCVIATDQAMSWQQLVMTKEILHILDPEEQRTRSKLALSEMFDNRIGDILGGTGLNVVADNVGLVLAVGSLIPKGYRRILREQDFIGKYPIADLERMLNIPSEFIVRVLSSEFEQEFERAITSIAT